MDAQTAAMGARKNLSTNHTNDTNKACFGSAPRAQPRTNPFVWFVWFVDKRKPLSVPALCRRYAATLTARQWADPTAPTGCP